jgi:hemerythrin
MGAVEWDERYSVGVRELDEQHKQMFEMLDGLFESMDTVMNSRTVSEVLAGLKKYALVHFETEERYMSECGYPDMENHKWEHEQFKKKVDSLCSDRAASPELVLTDILDFLYTWLTNHILSCDKKYATLVCSYQR